MSEPAVLNLILFLPVIGMALLPLARSDGMVRQVTFWVMVVQFILTLWLYVKFQAGVPELQFETRLPWIAQWGVHYHIGLDGFNVLLVLLTAFLGPLVVAGAFSAITKDVKLFYAMVFLIQFTMLGTFLAQDLFLFYVFWEAMLIPMFLIIGIWGGERRIYATVKFVLYTAFGSILMLAAIIYLVYSLQQGTGVSSFSFADLYRHKLPVEVQGWLLAAFALSFAIKVPIVPLHTWLPDAHVEAPTAGSVILAGVLLKMGTYGFIKLGFPLFPEAVFALAGFFAFSFFGLALRLVGSGVFSLAASVAAAAGPRLPERGGRLRGGRRGAPAGAGAGRIGARVGLLVERGAVGHRGDRDVGAHPGVPRPRRAARWPECPGRRLVMAGVPDLAAALTSGLLRKMPQTWLIMPGLSRFSSSYFMRA